MLCLGQEGRDCIQLVPQEDFTEEVAFEQVYEGGAGWERERIWRGTLSQQNAQYKHEREGHEHVWMVGWVGVDHEFQAKHLRFGWEGKRN